MRHMSIAYGVIGLLLLVGWIPFGPMYYGVPWHLPVFKWAMLSVSIGYLAAGSLLACVERKGLRDWRWLGLGLVAGILALLIMVDWLRKTQGL